MEILEGETLYKTLLQRYSKNPSGWSFSISPSRNHGFFDALVASPDESWQLKLDTIFKPAPFVMGARSEVEQKNLVSQSPVSFGFRRINPEHMAQFGAADDAAKLLAFLSSMKPVAPNAGGSYLEGPFLYSQARTIEMSRHQQTIDERLSSELLKLVRRRYPSYL